MKCLLFALFLPIVLIGCTSKASTTEAPETTGEAAPGASDHAHHAKNSLDYIGLYKGVLPCADCEGIETSLFLMANDAFLLTKKYLGKDDKKEHKNIGDFTWNAEGNTIILEGISNAPNQYFVAENQVIQLDMAGSRITGDLADQYILIKQ